MPVLPTVRVSLGPGARQVLLLGLDKLAHDLDARHLRNCRDLVRVQHWIPDTSVYSGRAHDEEMQMYLLSAHSKLKDMPACGKARFHLFEVAALAFALRLVERMPEFDNVSDCDLARRIETSRKHALRAARKSCGEQVIDEMSVRWRRFLEFCRYNFTGDRPIKLPMQAVKMLQSKIREDLPGLIQAAVVEFGYFPLSADELKHVTKLIRRDGRRCTISLKDVVTGSREKALERLFPLCASRRNSYSIPMPLAGKRSWSWMRKKVCAGSSNPSGRRGACPRQRQPLSPMA